MKKLLNKYADVVVKVGVNIQKGQTLVIDSPIECADFVRAVVESAYNAGAGEVTVSMQSLNTNTWCMVSVPTEKWAQKVFPKDSTEKAIKHLWKAIFKATRIEEKNPVQSWKNHLKNLNDRVTFLNEKRFKKLHYTNSKGTDLWIGLPKKHLWISGASVKVKDKDITFVPNMPTEEVFTLPDKNDVNGVVYSALPLSYNGNIIENFCLTFKDGKVIDYKAEKGEEALKNILDSDEGSQMLGEIALIPYDSPVSNTKTIFYNTLFDENASCHLALGRAYVLNYEGADKMSKEELEKCGVNYSMNHVDFMIGTKDLSIVGYTENDEEIQLFKDGNWAI